jgi:hypothetical protein
MALPLGDWRLSTPWPELPCAGEVAGMTPFTSTMNDTCGACALVNDQAKKKMRLRKVLEIVGAVAHYVTYEMKDL